MASARPRVSPASGALVAPTLPAAPTAVEPGIEPRFLGLVKLIKAHPAYNVAIGEKLGIEGAMGGGPDLSTIKPQRRGVRLVRV